MKLCGLQKTTLLDFPGKVAATIFTGGCSFACPFCHNSELLGRDTEALCSQEEVMTFLEKRKNILDGACITGGEPTLQPGSGGFYTVCPQSWAGSKAGYKRIPAKCAH